MILLKLLSHLPMTMLYMVGDLIFLLNWFVIGYRRKVIETNLRKAFPEKACAELHHLHRQFYRRFSEYLMETLKALTISQEELLKRVKYEDLGEVNRLAAEGKSIIVIASHQFNWEWALQAGCLVLPFPVDAVYKRLSNPSMDRLMRDARARFGGKPIEKSRVLREILTTRDRQRSLGIVADQSPRANSPKHWTRFMNQETAFYLGAQQLAYATTWPVFFFDVRRVKRGHYKVALRKLAVPPYNKDENQILENYAKATESLIRHDPAGYMWSHKRWKLQKEPAD